MFGAESGPFTSHEGRHKWWPSWLRRGDWIPSKPPQVRIFIMYIWFVEVTVRGFDYITGDNASSTSTLSVVEQAMPLWSWGALCLGAGVTMLIGMSMRWPRLVIGGAHVAGATYFALAIGMSVAVWQRGGDGFRSPATFFIIALTFWAVAIGYSLQLVHKSDLDKIDELDEEVGK